MKENAIPCLRRIVFFFFIVFFAGANNDASDGIVKGSTKIGRVVTSGAQAKKALAEKRPAIRWVCAEVVGTVDHPPNGSFGAAIRVAGVGGDVEV